MKSFLFLLTQASGVLIKLNSDPITNSAGQFEKEQGLINQIDPSLPRVEPFRSYYTPLQDTSDFEEDYVNARHHRINEREKKEEALEQQGQNMVYAPELFNINLTDPFAPTANPNDFGDGTNKFVELFNLARNQE